MKVLAIFKEVNGEYLKTYFIKISNGLIVTTNELNSASKYKNEKGIRIAKGHIRKWGHDELLISEDLPNEERKEEINQIKNDLLQIVKKIEGLK